MKTHTPDDKQTPAEPTDVSPRTPEERGDVPPPTTEEKAATGSALQLVRLDDPEAGGTPRHALKFGEQVIDLGPARDYQLETFPAH